MKQGEISVSPPNLLVLELVFALSAALLSVPIDLLRIWNAVGIASPTVPLTEFHLIRGLVFGTVTFVAWRWILPRLHGAFFLRLLVQSMLGFLIFGLAFVSSLELWKWLTAANVALLKAPDLSPAAGLWYTLAGSTLYMMAGGYALERVSRQQKRLAESALTSQLEALRNQINHHFLFNSLNLIAELTTVDAERAEGLVIQLADVLRYSLGATKRRLAPLSDEIAAVQSYLELERARSEDRIKVQVSVAPEVSEVPIPPLLIQPLVENAVRHGLQNGNCPGTVSIQAHREEDTLLIKVRDDGVGIDPEQMAARSTGGVALSNLRERLKAFYGERANFHLSSIPAGGATAEIVVPLTAVIDQVPPRHGLVWRAFFYHSGSMLAVALFFFLKVIVHAPFMQALALGWIVQALYLVVASGAAELKLQDLGFTTFFMTGLIATWLNEQTWFAAHATVLAYLYLAAVATVPQIFGFEPFTTFWARRLTPDWVQNQPTFLPLCNDTALMWGGCFMAASASAAAFSHSWTGTAIVPIALCSMAMPMSYYYPKFAVRRYLLKGGGSTSAATFIRGLPSRLKPERAIGLDVSVQFVVSGGEPGNYFIELRDCVCVGGQGFLRDPTLTVYAPAEALIRISRNEMTAEEAVRKAFLRVRGDEQLFLQVLSSLGLRGGEEVRAAA